MGGIIFVDRHTIAFKRVWEVEPDVLWNLMATKKGLATWFMQPDSEPKTGAICSFMEGWTVKVSCHCKYCCIQFRPLDSNEAYLRLEMNAYEGLSEFLLVDRMDSKIDAATLGVGENNREFYQPGGVGTHWSGILAGYHEFVDGLEKLVSNKINSSYSEYSELCRFYAAYLDKRYMIRK